MADYQIIIRGHLVLAFGEIPDGFIAIQNGKVALIAETQIGLPSAEMFYDYQGCYILPAAIDAQVHSRSQKGQEDFIWSTKSAAVGGVGTIIDMPYDAGSLICNVERFEQKKQSAQQQSRVDFALYATVHPTEGSKHIPDLVKAGAIGFKFSTFGTDPERFPRISPPIMHDCFKTISSYGLVASVHNEDDETVKTLLSHLEKVGKTDYTAHSLSRPIYAENIAIAQIYELGADTQCRTHIVHCSNRRGYEICQAYQSQGYQSTIEACLHYLVLSEEDLSQLGGKAKVNPPIRGKNEREALWQHLSTGNITVVSTDHVSWSQDRKSHRNIFKNASGATGLGILVPLLVQEAIARHIPLFHLVRVLSYNPARLFNIQHQKGALEIGKDADLVILKKESYIYDAKVGHYNFSDWSPYDGKQMEYKVEKTMVRGQWVFDGKTVIEPGYGQFVCPL